MSAATVTAPISTDERSGQIVQFPVEANVNIFTGTIVAIDGSGNATYAQDVAGQIVQGRAEFDALNGNGIAGAQVVNVKRSVFKYTNSSRSSASYALTAAMVGQVCYIENEQTVQTAAGSSHQVKAGIFLGIDPNDGGVWVDMRNSGSVGDGYTQTQSTIADNSTGTPAAPVSGVRTIAAVTSYATAANAVADIAAELNLIHADIAAIKNLL